MAKIADITMKVEMTDDIKERLDRIEQKLDLILNHLPEDSLYLWEWIEEMAIYHHNEHHEWND